MTLKPSVNYGLRRREKEFLSTPLIDYSTKLSLMEESAKTAKKFQLTFCLTDIPLKKKKNTREIDIFIPDKCANVLFLNEIPPSNKTILTWVAFPSDEKIDLSYKYTTIPLLIPLGCYETRGEIKFYV